MKILIIDDQSERHFGYRSIYYPQNEMRKAFTVKSAIAELERFNFDLVHLDHDLQDFENFNDGRKPIEHTGMEICKYLINKQYSGKVIIHSWNTVAAHQMKKMFEDNGIDVSYEPYSIAKIE